MRFSSDGAKQHPGPILSSFASWMQGTKRPAELPPPGGLVPKKVKDIDLEAITVPTDTSLPVRINVGKILQPNMQNAPPRGFPAPTSFENFLPSLTATSTSVLGTMVIYHPSGVHGSASVQVSTSSAQGDTQLFLMDDEPGGSLGVLGQDTLPPARGTMDSALHTKEPDQEEDGGKGDEEPDNKEPDDEEPDDHEPDEDDDNNENDNGGEGDGNEGRG